MSIEPADLQLFKYYRSCRFFYGNKAGRARKGDAPGDLAGMPDIRRLQEEAVRITVQEDGDNREQVLFRGIIQSVHTFVENGVCQVMCPAAGFPWKQESLS